MNQKKVKLRMGIHNRITAERFHTIKGAIANGMTGPAIEKKYDVKRTTLQYIRRAKTFYEYRLLTERLPRGKKMPTVYGEKTGLPFEDYGYTPIFFSVKKVKPTQTELSNRLDQEAESSARGIGLMLTAALVVVGIAVICMAIIALVK